MVMSNKISRMEYNDGEGDDMNEDSIVLAAASTYDKKFYLNPEFDQLPQSIKEHLKVICVTHTADVGGIITLKFLESGSLIVEAMADEEDILYDEIGSHLRIKRLQSEEMELFEALEIFFKTFYLGEDIE